MAVSWQRNLPVTSGTVGANLVVDLTSDAVGDLCILGMGSTTAITVPGGWTQAAINVATDQRIVAYRVKQSGDTTFTFDVEGIGNSRLLGQVFRGATFGEITAPSDTPASGSTIPFDALTLDATSASVLFAFWRGGGTTATPPTGYTEHDQGAQVWSAWDLTVSAGSLDPPDVTIGANRINRIGWHVELTSPTNPVDGPELDLKWDLAGVVEQPASLKWDTKAEIARAASIKWNLRYIAEFTHVRSYGHSGAAGQGATGNYGYTEQVADHFGSNFVQQALGGSTAQFHDPSGANCGYSRILQNLGSLKAQNSSPFEAWPDGEEHLSIIQLGHNDLANQPLDLTGAIERYGHAMRAIISANLWSYVYAGGSTRPFTSSSGLTGVAATDRNEGDRYYTGSAGAFATFDFPDDLPEDTVFTVGGLSWTNWTAVWEILADSISQGTLDQSTVDPAGTRANGWCFRLEGLAPETAHTIRAQANSAGTNQALLDYMAIETPNDRTPPVIVVNTTRPIGALPHFGSTIAEQEQLIADLNTELQAVVAEFAQAGRPNPVRYIDADAAFDKDPQYYDDDDLHYSDAGHELIKELIVAEIAAWDDEASQFSQAVNAEQLSVPWDVSATVDGAPLDVPWDLSSEVSGGALDVVWDMGGDVDAPAIAVVWDTIAEVAGAAALRWDLRAETTSNELELLWDAAGSINAPPLRLVADVATEAAATLGVAWDLRAAVAPAQTSLLWDLHAERARALTTVWGLSAETASAVSLIWGLYTPVEQSTSLIWALKAGVASAALDLSWDTIAERDAAILQLVWEMATEVEQVKIALSAAATTKAGLSAEPVGKVSLSA